MSILALRLPSTARMRGGSPGCGLGQEAGTPLVAVGDCLYHSPRPQGFAGCSDALREKCTIENAGYRLEANAERHLKSPAEILRLYRGYESAVASTLEIAARCRFSLDELRYEYPDESDEPFASPQDALVAHSPGKAPQNAIRAACRTRSARRSSMSSNSSRASIMRAIF